MSCGMGHGRMGMKNISVWVCMKYHLDTKTGIGLPHWKMSSIKVSFIASVEVSGVLYSECPSSEDPLYVHVNGSSKKWNLIHVPE